MEPRIAALVVLTAILLIWLLTPTLSNYWQNRFYMVGNTRPVHSDVDGDTYRVHMEHDDPGAAADTLAYLNNQSIQLMAYLRRRYLPRSGSSTQLGSERAMVAQKILDRYDRDRLAESSPNNPEGDTSFTLNKGTLLALCLREKDPTGIGSSLVHDMHDRDILWFVTIHELAHLGIDESGHPPKFWSCFKYLLEASEAAGLAPRGGWPNYSLGPVQYCGLSIDYNPLFDPETSVML